MIDNGDSDEFDEQALEQLRNAARPLPREMAPSPDAWVNILQRIESGRVRVLAPELAREPAREPTRDAVDGGDNAARRARTQNNWRIAAFAATVLVAVTAAVILKRSPAPVATTAATRNTAPAIVATVHDTAVDVTTAPQLSPTASNTMTAVFDRYDAAANDLATELNSRRERLDPATLAVLDSCLRTIDGAISESRSALAKTPGNATVAELLAAVYQQKLDLLRRSAELPLHSFQE